ncbi:hypothetical protein BKA67DRAFT_533430 [Truncatella angustata]|uniref:Uncharacterized protein n=1 Tax=Truncatella angustata TaxID=152316 RepID=A0A9P8UTL6_9PEZI|nr:uncharacterized protein BKA67DRAFT_533430 [Truncatella angustata]KAH6658272.1 hypothetical protein BKA67DRAFT_533430 [Truncatella angustata]
MISMQRSLSSPVRIHSSPPLSPTNTQLSESPTPSPESRRSDKSRPRRFRSRSPSEARLPEPVVAPVISLPVRRSIDSERHSYGSPGHRRSASAQKKPLVAQESNPTTAATAAAPAAAAAAVAIPSSEPTPSKSSNPPEEAPTYERTEPTLTSKPPPLLRDASLYSNPQLNFETEGTTLEELAHLVRLSKYQERKRANTRVRLQRSLISTALSARLTRCGEITQRNLADHFRTEDKKAFANLFGAIHDVRNSCDDTRRYALLEPDTESVNSPGLVSTENLDTPTSGIGSNAGIGSVVPFLNDISASAREAFLNFLTQIRTNPDYLASRLSSLTNTELQALNTFHQGSEPVESVLPLYSSRPSGRGPPSTSIRTAPQSPNAVERLLSFQRHDALSALIHTTFANSAGPDSAEDRRRNDIWANACARLISEAKFSNSANESILYSVLDVWYAMRDWSGRSNMEWYLMKILEDGAFLLDRAEDQNGTRFNISEWTHKDNVASDEFYDRAIDDLFEVLDDEDATGIPEGVIELGSEILRRLDPRLIESVRRWFVSKWLFGHWLPDIVAYPERHGMMAEYHITEYGRQKILKKVAAKAKDLVIDMTWTSAKKPVATPPKVKTHVENILRRFKPSRSQRIGRLLPARSITSLRETAEVHPYLVISPADLLTLVNALFPERRPQSAHSSSIRSGAPSISGFSAISQPISFGTSRSNFDTASVLSLSTSSVVSDAATSKEPLLDDPMGTPQRYSPPVLESGSQKRSSNYEDDGYRLRLAMHEMVQILGHDVVSGSCHPCAERWAVLFISADGNNLSLQMTYDPDDDPEEENSSTTSDTEDEDLDDRPELDKDYHQLRDSILKLVEDFEIPRGLEDDGAKTTLSNRATGLKKYRSKNKIITTESSMASRNPYRRLEQEKRERSSSQTSPTALSSADQEPPHGPEPQPVLVIMLEAASSQSRVQSDFVSAHLYWRTLQQLNALSSPSLRKNGYATLLNIFSRGPRDSIRRSHAAVEEYDAWLVWLKQSQERHEGLIDSMMKRLKTLRDKMWYVTDVHNSAPYEHTRSICSALKIMGVPRRWGTFQRTRAQLSRGPAANYLYKNESQMLDILAASEEQGGPNKLSDDQADKTSKWLHQMRIENICQGEERIHRFCCELDSCVSKLVGDTIVDGPVLWSSELFQRDRKALEGATKTLRERDSFWGGDDAASVISDPERRYTSPSNRPNSIARDLRSMTTHNVSQISFDSRYNFSRNSAAMSDILDSEGYFGVASPVHTMDTNSTFWSPFHSTMPSATSVASRAHSPTTSISNFSNSFSHPYGRPIPSQQSGGRPGTSTSSNETVHLQRQSEEKQRFLEDLRQTLASLLLSDLGNYVFSMGSETDAWFDGLGQQCIDRREEQEQRNRRQSAKKDRTAKNGLKHRVIEKKKSFGNLRVAGENAAAESTSEQSETPTVQSQTSTGSNSTISGRSRRPSKDSPTDFPYKKAYQRLLRQFCVHPNPQTKLAALFEMKHLVEASLATSGRRSKWALRNQLAAQEDHLGSTGVLEDAIDSVRERRSQAVLSPILSPVHMRSSANVETRSIVSVAPANTDAIAIVLESLFKDPSIRPKTLFRDLQYIASFVPADILDRSEKGKAFFDTTLAALALKQEVCKTMVEVADEVIKMDQQIRKPSSTAGSSDGTDSTRSPTAYSLSDAAKMLTITAKEGSHTAQRELGFFNLSYPELVERTIMPLSKPREVFKQSLMEKFGARPGSSARHPADRIRGLGSSTSPAGGSDGSKDVDVKNDPALHCVAFHWFGVAAQGDDEVAKLFLEQNEINRT